MSHSITPVRLRAVALLVLTSLLAPAASGQIQLGADIDGEGGVDWSGTSVSLDGDRLAIGARLNDGVNGSNSGHTRVYEWDATADGGAGAWARLGADIDGETAFDGSGLSVSLSGDRLAIGAPFNDGVNGSDSGHTRVYEWDATADGGAGAWAQLGADIDGEAASDLSGWSVSLDGDRLAVGAYQNDGNGSNSGHTRVYEWDATADGGAGAWAQLGADIDGEAVGDLSGRSVSLDGDRLAIGADRNDGVNGSNSGYTRVYEWDATADGGAGAWARLGADIDGEAASDESGTSVSLDGDRLAIGAPGNDGVNGSLSGHTRVYEWDATADGGAGAWARLGADIDGEAASDESGTSVSLDGDRLAIGAIYNDGNGDRAGHTRVYEWDATADGGAGAWARLGADIDGETAGDQSGLSVSLDGDRLAIGAPFNDGVNGSDSGHTRVSTFAPQPVSSVTLDGAEGWRMLASPEGTTVGAFLADLWTQGFTGADNPAGECTVFIFSEGAASFEAGWTCVTDAADAFARGEGLMVYVYEDDDNDGTVTAAEAFPKTLSASAAFSPTGDFAFSVALTDDGRPLAQKGWNLLGAPFGTSLDWDGVVRTGVTPTVYVYDPAFGPSGGYRTYTSEGGAGYGDLPDGLVPPFQGFFVKAYAPTPALSLPEAGGTADGQDVYGRSTPTDPPLPPVAPVQSASVATDASGAPEGATALRAIAPNPTTGAATVSWTLAEAGPVRLTVVDLLGREVAVLADRAFVPGSHRAEVPAGLLAPGVYVVRLQAGAVTEAARFSVVR